MATPRAREPAGRKPRASGEQELNSVFSGLSSDIQNDLIKSIAQVIRDEIKSEINFAKFVSVIADETPDISHREQMSVIFRYLTKTGIEERFVGRGRCTAAWKSPLPYFNPVYECERKIAPLP
ncbi:hypothetical protein EVAR_9262_1 [Eumeta japonica]|uniref:Uncharacterized protein n=1 Tax=Eumeta variegata TaxID=151549 RepID=A0A4C1TLL5_EUMVA|nr:hypothetical protein EVAR_9262_1 [Eumeta japonica]